MEARFNPMQLIKRELFAHRNGIVAERVRRAGMPYPLVFGVTLAELAQIAADHGFDPELALRLRADRRCRESMLLAPMLVDPATVTLQEALQWAGEAPTTEVADVVANRLLRKVAAADELIPLLGAPENSDMLRYMALRLNLNLLHDLDVAEARARREMARNCPLTVGVARQIINEVEWRRSEL